MQKVLLQADSHILTVDSYKLITLISVYSPLCISSKHLETKQLLKAVKSRQTDKDNLVWQLCDLLISQKH